METVYQRCCGLDVHKKVIVACVITEDKKEVRKFGTLTEEIMEMINWIKEEGCQCVAMESTGVYWKPIYNLFEISEVEAIVVNAQHIKAVPGRKTDVKDAEWIADLLRHGLLKGSYIPNREQRETRDMVRYRRSLIEERAREINRIQKVFEGANIKLSSVVSNINGTTSRQIIKILLEKDIPEIEELKKLMHGNMKSSAEEIQKALRGILSEHQKAMIRMMMRHIEYLDGEIAKLDEEISEKMKSVLKQIEQLDSILGVGERSAQTIIAEIGTDMSVFPTAGHLASWAGMCPGNNESAGKKKSGKTRKGNKTLRNTLVECAKAAAKNKNSYLGAQYSRISARRGKNRAAVAVGHSILVIAYHMLKDGKEYQDLGAEIFDKKKKEAIVKHTVKKLESLGYKVAIEEAV